jgi:hypothetical protein
MNKGALMKTLCMMIAAGLLVGCGGGEQQKLEAEVKRLRADVDRQQQTITNLVDMLDRHFTRSAKALEELEKLAGLSFAERDRATASILNLIEDNMDRLDTLEQRTNYVVIPKLPPAYTGTPRIRTAPETKPEPVDPLRDGVPPHVFARIQQEAAKEWPNNYAMQSYEVKRQTAAWKRLNP